MELLLKYKSRQRLVGDPRSYARVVSGRREVWKVPERLMPPEGFTVMTVPSGMTPPRTVVVAGFREIVPVPVIGPPLSPVPVET
jgi:hypothetical protein